MEEKEKLKGAKKLTCQMTDGDNTLLIIDENNDGLVCRTKFYNEGLNLTVQEKREFGKKLIENIFSIISQRETNQWKFRCDAFIEAYQYEKKDKIAISWLMTTILGIPTEEADRRFDVANELMSHPDFKDREDEIVNKLYINSKFTNKSGVKIDLSL